MTALAHASEGHRSVAAAEFSSLELTLRALRPLLSDRDVTELCINSPGEAYVETRRGWERREAEPPPVVVPL